MITYQPWVDVRELDRLMRNLRVYMQLRYKKSEDEILTQKGNDLRIKLFQGFWAHRFLDKKSRKFTAGKIRELIGKWNGIKVRLNQLRSPWDGRVPATDKNGKPLSMHQKLVAQEVMRRISGTGVLGVSFLGKRWRFNKKDGYFLVTNRTNKLGTAATFLKRSGEYIITGFTPGLGRIAERYGILSNALSVVSADVEEYIAKKLGPEFLQTLHAP